MPAAAAIGTAAGPESPGYIFDDTGAAFDAIADVIAAFERSDAFAPFDSRFDHYLRGELELTAGERRGLSLFEDERKGNCAACHPVPGADSARAESLFTDFSYDNLGVPTNTRVRSLNGKPPGHADRGLLNNPRVDDPELSGAFRVSSLRNVAVTAPYMHNGVFSELETVVHFYNSRDVAGAINPETGMPWEPAEVGDTRNTEELGDLGLTEEEVDDIVGFLRTLTDSRNESL